MKNLIDTVLLLSEKDVRIEFRSKQMIFSTLLFVILVLVIFNLSFSVSPDILNRLAPGIIWVVIALSGTIAMSQLSRRDDDDRVREGLLMSGVSGTTLFFSKLITTLFFMLGIEAVVIPLFMLFFNFEIGDWFWMFLTVLALGTVGYAAVGTLFSELLSHTRLRDLLLPVIFYPVIIPILIVAVKATAACMQGEVPQEIFVLIGVDIIFLTACALLFDFALEDLT